MKIRGIEFGNVLGASGVQGFFGEGYWFHFLWKLFGLDLAGLTFVAKTATLLSRPGNMKLTRDFTPREFFPACVRASFSRQAMVNAVGLANPGLGALLGRGKWQTRTQPFWLSLMCMEQTPARRLEEMCIMVDMLGLAKPGFLAPFGLQINLSCPNTDHNPKELIGESEKILDIAGKLAVPLMPKFSIASAPVEAVLELGQHPCCDAICVSNTVPFGWPGIDWQKAWGSSVSPLQKLGGGGYSGKELGPPVRQWIRQLRELGFEKPINGGGGILCCQDVTEYNKVASSVFLGSVIPLYAYNPWHVREIINYANSLEWRQ